MSSMDFICINLIHRELKAIALGILLLDCVELGDTCKNQNRTFVILALERGMRPEVVMKITGHTKLSTLQRYITISDTVVEAEMMRAFG